MTEAAGSLFLDALQSRVEETLDACTRCGKCVAACPMVEPAGIDLGTDAANAPVIVEGVRVGARAVLGAGVVLTGNTPVIDVTGPDPVEHRGSVPSEAIVIPGVRQRSFPAGTYGLPSGLIIGYRGVATDAKIVLNDVLREFGLPADPEA